MRPGRGRVRAAVAAGFLVATAAWPPVAAAAADPVPPQLTVDSVVVTPGHARLVLTTTGLPSGAESGVTAQAGGVAVPARVEPPAAAPPRAVMLLLDISLSMTGSDIAAARGAAAGYLAALPPGVLVGLVTFADRPRLVRAPTADRAAVRAAVAAAVPAGATTALYDAVGVAAAGLAAAGLGPAARLRIVLLTDGRVDNTSTTSLSAARDGLAARAIPVDVLASGIGQGGPALVDGLAAAAVLASAAGGRVGPVSDAPALAAAGSARPVTVVLDVPASVADRPQQLVVRMGGAVIGAPVRFAPDPRPAGPAPAPVAGPAAPPSPSPALLALLAGVFGSVLGAVLLLAGGARPGDRGRRLVEQIGHYSPGAGADGGTGHLERAAVGWATALLRAVHVEQRLAVRLDLAGTRRRPADWVVLGAGLGAAAAAALTVLTGTALVGVPAGLLAGWLGMRYTLSFRISRRRAAFGEQLPDVLQLVAGSLQSGFSLQQALDAVVRDGTQPAAGETSRALAQTRIGVGLETALDKVADRMGSTDMRWVVMAIRIQREVGGNLAEVLLNTVATMRERAQTRRQVRALSAEGRLSAYILIGLPVGVGGFLFVSKPDYMRPLYTTGLGLALLTAAGVMVAAGSFWMSKVIKVEV